MTDLTNTRTLLLACGLPLLCILILIGLVIFLVLFFRKKKAAENPAKPAAAQQVEERVNGIYILAFTPEKLATEDLRQMTQVANGMLKEKYPRFKELLDKRTAPQSRVEIANIEHSSIMHTPQNMQTTLSGWVRNQYHLECKLLPSQNFFLHGMHDAQGRENFVLYYFDLQ